MTTLTYGKQINKNSFNQNFTLYIQKDIKTNILIN
jgi:hypothetical protein